MMSTTRTLWLRLLVALRLRSGCCGVAEMAGAVGLDSDEPLPVVAEAVAQADADHRIAELARAWHAREREHRAETEGHLRAAAASLIRARAALVAALDAEVES